MLKVELVYRLTLQTQMIHPLQGPYAYNGKTVSEWSSTAIGVYYCGYINSRDKLHYPHYIGKGVGAGGMRERLSYHLRDDDWPDVTHFMIRFCDTPTEAERLEMQEIARCQPKYNKIGK